MKTVPYYKNKFQNKKAEKVFKENIKFFKYLNFERKIFAPNSNFYAFFFKNYSYIELYYA